MSVAVSGEVIEQIDAQIEKYQNLLQILQKQKDLEAEKTSILLNGSVAPVKASSVSGRGRKKGSKNKTVSEKKVSSLSSSDDGNKFSCDDSLYILLDKKVYKKKGLSFVDIAEKIKETGWKPKKDTKKPAMTLRQSVFRLSKEGFLTKEKADDETVSRYVLTDKVKEIVGYNAKE